MQGEMIPASCEPSRFSSVTRDGCLVLLQVTPCQLQMSVEVFLLHDTKAPVGSDSWDLKHRRVIRSPSTSASWRVLVSSVYTASVELLDVARVRRYVKMRHAWREEGTMLLSVSLCLLPGWCSWKGAGKASFPSVCYIILWENCVAGQQNGWFQCDKTMLTTNWCVRLVLFCALIRQAWLFIFPQSKMWKPSMRRKNYVAISDKSLPSTIPISAFILDGTNFFLYFCLIPLSYNGSCRPFDVLWLSQVQTSIISYQSLRAI
jgi:hypothetical protein